MQKHKINILITTKPQLKTPLIFFKSTQSNQKKNSFLTPISFFQQDK